jgi:hypothetical protein
MRLRDIRALVLAAAPLLAFAPSAAAQVDEPIGRYVADVRGAWARFKEDPAVAAAIAVEADNLPTRGLGVVVGAHWYPLRIGRVTLGVGGELLLARDSRTRPPASDTAPEGPTVNTRMTSLSPQLSLNFGRKNGWSYISGGIGWAGFTAERADVPIAGAEGRTRSINYGGGARWFTGKHLAVAVDVRFYTVNAQLPAAGRPAFPRLRTMVISAGVGLR